MKNHLELDTLEGQGCHIVKQLAEFKAYRMIESLAADLEGFRRGRIGTMQMSHAILEAVEVLRLCEESALPVS